MINGMDEKVYSVKLSQSDLELIQLALTEIENSKTRTIVDTICEPKNIDARKECSKISTRLGEMISTLDVLSKMQQNSKKQEKQYTFLLSILEK